MADSQESTTAPSLGRRIFLAGLGTALLTTAAAVATNGAPFGQLFENDPFKRRSEQRRVEGNRAVLRTGIYTNHDGFPEVSYFAIRDAHGRVIAPDMHVTADDIGVLEGAIMYAHESAVQQMRGKLAEDIILAERQTISSFADKAKHITPESARESGIDLTQYIKPYKRISIR